VKAPKGLRGLCLEAEKTQSLKILENATISHASGACFVGLFFFAHDFTLQETIYHQVTYSIQ
jgi:hypothetical protein